MKKVIRLTESELTNLIHRIIVETEMGMDHDMMKDGEMEEVYLDQVKKKKKNPNKI